MMPWLDWLGLALVLSVVPGLVMLSDWLTRRRERRLQLTADQIPGLLEQGLVAEAEIIGYEINDGEHWVSYCFQPAGYAKPLRCSKQISVHASRLSPGSLTPVRYLAAKPQVSVLLCHRKSLRPLS